MIFTALSFYGLFTAYLLCREVIPVRLYDILDYLQPPEIFLNIHLEYALCRISPNISEILLHHTIDISSQFLMFILKSKELCKEI